MTIVMAGTAANLQIAAMMTHDSPAGAAKGAPRTAVAAPAFERLQQLLDHLLDTHHVYTRLAIERLPPLADQVLAAHGKRHPELLGVVQLVGELMADLRPHLMKEEMVLFPYIRELEEEVLASRAAPRAPFGTLDPPLRCMLAEHDRVDEILRELGRVTGGYTCPDDACTAYRTLYTSLAELEADLRQHIHLENEVLFPAARDLERRAHGG